MAARPGVSKGTYYAAFSVVAVSALLVVFSLSPFLPTRLAGTSETGIHSSTRQGTLTVTSKSTMGGNLTRLTTSATTTGENSGSTTMTSSTSTETSGSSQTTTTIGTTSTTIATTTTTIAATTTTTTSVPPPPTLPVLTVTSRYANGTALSGLQTLLSQSGTPVESGYTPVQFTLQNGKTYQLKIQGYGTSHFQYWTVDNWVNVVRNVSITTDTTLTGVFCPTACSDASIAPAPTNGITVYASRIPATYWAPCFATACSAGTGPGASMYFVLQDSQGNVLQSGFSDEWGMTFTGLTPGVAYYVLPEDCNLCHGSAHNVVFQYWDGGSTVRPLPVQVGMVLKAWYSCTNLCASGP